jgi:hypothetical protein
MNKLTILVLAMVLTGCAARTEILIPALPLPDPPTLPTIPADEMLCLSDEAYEALVERDALRREYANRLRAIIEAHNGTVR